MDLLEKTIIGDLWAFYWLTCEHQNDNQDMKVNEDGCVNPGINRLEARL